ncbi:MAG: OB-fold putative lipoprotein [Puniceicoccales bacterium]|jgi:hypothetical protein|nr:OB-fold putative lipoprotein [Puniceicoccales bacterium]
MNKRKHSIAGIFILAILVMVGLSVSTLANGNDKEAVPDSIIAAKDLYDAFKNDKQAAGELYSQKTINVKGFVVYTGPDAYALPSVELSDKKGGNSRLLCVLPFSDFLKLGKVSKGEEIVIRGEVRALYEKGDMVLLKQCEIQEEKKDAPRD